MTQKIVYFVDSAVFGGSEQALLHLLARLDRAHWEPVLFHHAEPGIQFLKDEARRLGVATRLVPHLQGFKAVAGFSEFLSLLKAENPAVFHAQLSWLLSCKFGILAARMAKKPAVFATLQQYLLPPWGNLIDIQQRLVEANVDQYIAVSHAIAHQLSQSFHVPAHKVRVIHNSIPFEKYDCQEDLALRRKLTGGRDVPVVLTVARLDSQKGLDYLLEAAKQVPGALFFIAGSGPERDALHGKAIDLGIEERVVFLGHRNDIPGLLSACDLFVLPSRYEGLPLSVLEAMAAGKAVIATDVGGTSEAVVAGETGLLVPSGDAGALSDAIRSLLSTPWRMREMGAAGKALVAREFSATSMVRQIEQAYEDVLHQKALDGALYRSQTDAG